MKEITNIELNFEFVFIIKQVKIKAHYIFGIRERNQKSTPLKKIINKLEGTRF